MTRLYTGRQIGKTAEYSHKRLSVQTVLFQYTPCLKKTVPVFFFRITPWNIGRCLALNIRKKL